MKQVGSDSSLYVNTGSYAVPTWTEVDIVTDVTISEGPDKLPATTRAQAKQRWKGSQIGMRDASWKADALVPVYTETNAGFDALITALRNGTTVDVLRTDGADKDTDGVEACRMIAGVFGGERKEPVEGITAQAFEFANVGSSDQEYPQYGTMSSGDFTPGS